MDKIISCVDEFREYFSSYSDVIEHGFKKAWINNINVLSVFSQSILGIYVV